MNYSDRNRKAALSRWKNFHQFENEKIKTGVFADSERALLCGFLAGDGYIKKRKEKNIFHYEINFYPDDELMLSSYCNAIQYLYSKLPAVKQKQGFFEVRINSKTIYEDLSRLCNFETASWTIPNIPNGVAAWLQGFYSAESYVTSRAIRLQTVNITGMKQISSKLKLLGIPNRYYEYQPKK